MVVVLRIRITLSKKNLTLPLAYQSIIQGIIYGLLSKTDIGKKYHDEGYQYTNKKFKCFVFSQLFGNYTIKDKEICFNEDFYFYLSSQDELFLKEIYKVLLHNEYLIIRNQRVLIKDICIFDLKPFNDIRKIEIKTLSPILIYSTHDDYSTYYKPSDKESVEYIKQNIRNKALAYNYQIHDFKFDICDILYEKKRMVKYKDCFYPAYLCEIIIQTNFEILSFIYNCGLSSKNSCGFGMIEVVNEESNLSI